MRLEFYVIRVFPYDGRNVLAMYCADWSVSASGNIYLCEKREMGEGNLRFSFHFIHSLCTFK